jgi:hypothetical protein
MAVINLLELKKRLKKSFLSHLEIDGFKLLITIISENNTLELVTRLIPQKINLLHHNHSHLGR